MKKVIIVTAVCFVLSVIMAITCFAAESEKVSLDDIESVVASHEGGGSANVEKLFDGLYETSGIYSDDSTSWYPSAAGDYVTIILKENSVINEIKVYGESNWTGYSIELFDENGNSVKKITNNSYQPASVSSPVEHDCGAVTAKKIIFKSEAIKWSSGKTQKIAELEIYRHVCTFPDTPAEIIESTCTEYGKEIYVCSTCGKRKEVPLTALGEHEYVESGLEYENGFDKAGALIKTCSVCNGTDSEETQSIINQTGYSLMGDGTQIIVGFTVNNELIAKYETLNNVTVEYGIFAVNKQYIEGAVLSETGEAINKEKTVISKVQGRQYSKFNMLISGFDKESVEYVDLELIISAFVIEKSKADNTTKVSFVQKDGTKPASETDTTAFYLGTTAANNYSFGTISLAKLAKNSEEQNEYTTLIVATSEDIRIKETYS